MRSQFLSLLNKITRSRNMARTRRLIEGSGLFDRTWYLAHNPDVREAGVDPLLHYLSYGGFEGRDPGPGFSSRAYLGRYPDVKQAGVNPLVHYLEHGQAEGRLAQPQPEPAAPPRLLYFCPVCKNDVEAFVPLSSFYRENVQQHGYPYTFEEAETLNSEGYTCPHCGASDRDRLYACYLEKRMAQVPAGEAVLLLDIAPSVHLGRFLDRFDNIVRHTADLLIKDVDFTVDVTNMPEIASGSYDALICSHVLEHVRDDGKALAELYRVLKPGGWAILMVPIITTIDQIDEDPDVTDEGERWRRFGQYDHVRLYSKRGFIDRVEKAGFHLHQLGVDYFGESTLKRYGITNKSVLYIGEKPDERLSKVRQSLLAGEKTNDRPPILTVIIITYNHKDFVARAIESVLEQETTYPYQIWITDDCSSDGTLEICNSYAEKYPDKIKVFAHSVNTFSTPGAVRHTDTAIRSVKTKYFCVLDGDDAWCDTQKIQIALDFLEANPEYTTFAHDTWYYDTGTGSKRSLVHDIHKIGIQNPISFEKAPYLHTSSRIHRNVVKHSEKRSTNGDIYLFYMYLDMGPLYYYDRVMSVYNVTGRGDWSGLSQGEKQKAGVTTQYNLNKYFNYRYDDFFTARLGETKRLNQYKKIFGKKLGWELWYHLDFMNTFSLQNIKSRLRQLAGKPFRKSMKHD